MTIQQEMQAELRPAALPEKFWDAEAQTIRLDALIKSYLELEKKLNRMVAIPSDDATEDDKRSFYKALGVPESPEDYAAVIQDGMPVDAEVNARLHAAGFTPQQAQLFYDLAAEKILPIIQDVHQDLQSMRDVERLQEYFGGRDKFIEISRQLMAWGAQHLPADVLEALGSSYDGVLTLHRMMVSQEPGLAVSHGQEPDVLSEKMLKAMMQDPRYWRDHDPAYVAQVQAGFKTLYGSES